MALIDSPPPAVAAPRIAGSLRLAARQFPRHRAAMLGLICLTLICLAAVLAPWIAPYDPVQIKLSAKLKPPSFEHWLGTDHFGRDVFSRLLYGGRTSLSVGLLGPDIQNVMLALGLVQAPVLARMVRGSTLAVREDVYVTAARALGAGPARIVLSHLLRNVMSPIVVQLTIVFAAAVVAEASLSFLGFGTQPPQPSWGRDMSEARRFLGDAPWMFLAPTIAIMLCVLSINFMGDGLRDALDPRAWRTRRTVGPATG